MVNVICDVCKKSIQQPERYVNYVTFQDKTICEACNDELKADIKTLMRGYETYSFATYKEEIVSLVDEKCS